MTLCLTCQQEISNEAYIKLNCCGESIHYNLPCLFNRIWVRTNNQKCPNILCSADFNAEERRELAVVWPAINETIDDIESFKETKEKCGICYNSENLMQLDFDCKQKFCEICLKQHFFRYTKCPYCNEEMTIEKRLRFTNKQRAKITFEIFDFVQMTGTIRDIAPEWKLNRKQTFDFLKEVNYQHYMELVESKIETDCVYICVLVKKIDLGNRSFITFDQGGVEPFTFHSNLD